MIRKIFILLIFQFLIFNFQFSRAQSPFRSGVFGGITFSQIDGDGYSGFDKAGLNIGGYVNNNFGWKKSLLQMELLYTNKGSRQPANPEKGIPPRLIKISYVEVPVLFRYYYKKIFFAAGFSYGQLITNSHKEYDISGEVTNPPPFHKYEIAFQGGASYFLTEKISVEFRAVRSFLPVRDYFITSQFGFFGITSSGIFGGSYNTALYYTFRYQFGKTDKKEEPKQEDKQEKDLLKNILKLE